MRVQVTTPPNTKRTDPQVTKILYNGETMKRQIIEIPKGHAYLTGLNIRAGNSAIIIPEPDSNTEWIVGENRVIEKNVFLKYDPPSFQIVITTYNEDDTYPHTHYLDME